MDDKNNGGIKINNINLNLALGGFVDLVKEGLETVFGKVFDKFFEEYYKRKIDSYDYV
ncbi:MAG: hypothetical protein QXD03_03195 [Candidatus Anstonellales archaeon]